MDKDDDDNSSISNFSSLSINKITNCDIYLHKFDDNENKLKENGGKFITPYQFEKAKEIYNNFKDKDNKRLSLIVAETQMGKTGIMQALTREFIENDNIEPNNILILTGLSSCEWVRQTQDRFIDMIKPNIFHRNTIEKFQNKLKDTPNLLIFLDEVHIATELKNNMGKIFKSCGLLNINNLVERNIKIIQISATPDAILSELYKWDETNYNISIIKSPDDYIGIEKLLNNGQIFEYKTLLELNNVKEIKTLIESKYGNNFKYHLIRVQTNAKDNKITIDNINKIFNNDNYYIKHFCTKDNVALKEFDDLNENYLDNKPNRHTIIVIKEKVRCSYTINKTHIGILYERKALKEQNEMTIIQGFLGRACGYYDNSDRNIIIFTNIEIINNYKYKIKQQHQKSLYEIKNKNKKNINDKDINYKNININNDIINNDKIIKDFNIKIIDKNIPTMEDGLIKNISKNEVYNKKFFDIILKNNNLYEFFYKFETMFKITFEPRLHNCQIIKKCIQTKSYIHYNDIYSSTSQQINKINISESSIIAIINKYQNEIYLIYYENK
jgi:hypothetical protein